MSDGSAPSLKNLLWKITWTLAFPTLVPKLVFTDEHEHDVTWQQLAWHALTSLHTRSTKGPKGTERLTSVDGHVTAKPVYTPCDHDWKDSVGYGEIKPSVVLALLHWLWEQQQTRPDLKLPDHPCIVDLGSGNGKVLMAACLSSFCVSKAIGIELLHPLHLQAVENCQHYKSVDWSLSEPEWDLCCADFTIEKDWIGHADVVFIHATVFEDDLREVLNSLCQTCRPGTVFCLVSWSLREVNGIRSIADFQLDMDWGLATVYLQQKTN